MRDESTSNSKTFCWTDEESALLLQTVLDYKTTKLSSGNDWETVWETVKNKYEDITKLFIAHYPVEGSDEFPNAEVKNKFTKHRITSKINKLKLGIL